VFAVCFTLQEAQIRQLQEELPRTPSQHELADRAFSDIEIGTLTAELAELKAELARVRGELERTQDELALALEAKPPSPVAARPDSREDQLLQELEALAQDLELERARTMQLEGNRLELQRMWRENTELKQLLAELRARLEENELELAELRAILKEANLSSEMMYSNPPLRTRFASS
jgi:chromosome segregation ATPase